jgi:Leucine-rich repeat (LRR) protein
MAKTKIEMETNEYMQWIEQGCDDEIAKEIKSLYINNISKYQNKNFNCFDNLWKIKELPIGLQKFTNLEKLTLNNFGFTTITKEIYNLKNLKYLDLSYNKIETTPYEICNLTNLMILGISYNCLKTLDINICNLTNLKNLYLDKNNIKKIHTNIKNLINLELLDMKYNKITNIPKEICDLQNLKILLLKNNKITTLPIEISNLTMLFNIDLCDNEFKIFPKEICKIINLKNLDISHNKLTILPTEIYNLTNLESLDISHNKLTILPTEIYNLTNLKMLDVSFNELTTLPTIYCMTNEIIIQSKLDKFRYDNNKIDYIPPHIDRLIRYDYKERKEYLNKCFILQNDFEYNVEYTNFKSVNYILSFKPIYKIEDLNKIILNNEHLTKKTKNILFKHMNDNIKIKKIHPLYRVTFSELLLHVISFIEKKETKNEIYKILDKDMNKEICEIFMCIMIVLMNCLNNIDNNININIYNMEQMGNNILTCKNKFIEKYKNIENNKYKYNSYMIEELHNCCSLQLIIKDYNYYIL